MDAGTDREPTVDLRRTVEVLSNGMGIRVIELSTTESYITITGVPMDVRPYDDDIDD